MIHQVSDSIAKSGNRKEEGKLKNAKSSRRSLWVSRPVSRILFYAAIYLGDASPRLSSSLPEGRASNPSALLFGLAPGGVYLADASPRLRCALTAPFHPYPPAPRSARRNVDTTCRRFPAPPSRRFAFCGTCLRVFPDWALPSTLLFGVRTFLSAARVERGR